MGGIASPNLQTSEAGLVASALWTRDRCLHESLGIVPLPPALAWERWEDLPETSQARYLKAAELILERLQDRKDNQSSMDLPDLARTYRTLLLRWIRKLDRETSGKDVDGTKLDLMDQQLKKVADALDKLSAVEVRIKRESLEEWARMSVRDKSDRMLQEVQAWPESAKEEFRDRFEVACPSRKLKAVR